MCAVVVGAVGRRGWSPAAAVPPLASSPLWPSCRSGAIGFVGSGGVECARGAGRPPLFERSDGATTLLEKVAARESSIELRKGEEDRSLPGVGPGVGGAGICSRLLRYQVELAPTVVPTG